MVKRILYLSILILFACERPAKQVVAQAGLQAIKPEDSGFIIDSLNLIEPYVKQFIDTSYLAGSVVMISRDNKIVYNKAVGHFNRNKTQELKSDDIFRLASMTKPIITVAALQLYEQGKLDVNDPVSKYIPSFQDPKVVVNFNKHDSSYTTRPASREITIHHLMTQTSGLSYGVFDPVAGPIYSEVGPIEQWTKDSVTLATNAKKIGKLPLLHDPGEKFTYGINTEVLARIVEIVSGMPLDEYLEKKIFVPLGMRDTHFYLPADIAHRLVEVWYRGDFTPTIFPEMFRDDYPVAGRKMYFSGGGGLVGSAPDYMIFANALLNKGSINGVQILKPETVNLMFSNQIGASFIDDKGVKFGYGASLYTNDGELGRKKGRYSWGGFWLTNFWIDPARNMVVVIMANAFDTPGSEKFFNGIEEIINNSVTDERQKL